MQIKVKKFNSEAVIPKYAKRGDAGMDLTAISKTFDPLKNTWVYNTGLGIEIPEGYVGLIFPRSSICNKQLSLTNSVGVIDSGYRGEIKFFFRPTSNMSQPDRLYEVGDRIGQLMILPFPQVEFVEVDDLGESERGSNGFGSSGR